MIVQRQQDATRAFDFQRRHLQRDRQFVPHPKQERNPSLVGFVTLIVSGFENGERAALPVAPLSIAPAPVQGNEARHGDDNGPAQPYQRQPFHFAILARSAAQVTA